jgi:hypothetical protein
LLLLPQEKAGIVKQKNKEPLYIGFAVSFVKLLTALKKPL